MFKMTSSHNQDKGKRTHDVFSKVAAINKLREERGRDNVADALIGVIKDDQGNFMTIPTYESVFRNLPSQELCDYSTIAGLPEFQKAAVESAFAGHVPAGCKTEVMATPGGMGAVYSTILNYVEKGEKYLGPDWYWGPYVTLGIEQECEYEMYQMFTDDLASFNLEAWKAKTLELIGKQNSLLTIFNTPANNPTGYAVSVDEWKFITDTYREICKDPDKKIIVLWDWSYTDYAGTKDETREFLKHFDNMPQNMLLLVAFSMSKSFLAYGMRSGALIACSTSQDVLDDFVGACGFTNRGTWSNGNRGAQKALANIFEDPDLYAAVEAERAERRDMLNKRGAIFMKEAEEIGLKCLPYKSGFFITVPCKEVTEAIDILWKQEVFLLSAGPRGIRIAVSSCPTKMIYGLAAKIKAVIDENGFTQDIYSE